MAEVSAEVSGGSPLLCNVPTRGKVCQSYWCRPYQTTSWRSQTYVGSSKPEVFMSVSPLCKDRSRGHSWHCIHLSVAEVIPNVCTIILIMGCFPIPLSHLFLWWKEVIPLVVSYTFLCPQCGQSHVVTRLEDGLPPHPFEPQGFFQKECENCGYKICTSYNHAEETKIIN